VTAERSAATCAECGAPLAPGRTCRDYFHDLLALEATVPGGPGEEPHFFAVATYNLQHPSGFMPPALVGLRRTLADVLARRATVADARRRARQATNGPTRVRRHADAELSTADQATLRAWPSTWSMTVRDVCEVAPAQYAARVRAWAARVTAELEAARPQITGSRS
jgi:hypothetical protein